MDSVVRLGRSFVRKQNLWVVGSRSREQEAVSYGSAAMRLRLADRPRTQMPGRAGFRGANLILR